jgi:hypothetical protein
MTEEPWLQQATDQLLARCGRALAIDIGANHGTWTRFLLPLFRRVVSVEPDERCRLVPGADGLRCLVGMNRGQRILHLSARPEQNHLSLTHPLHGTSGHPVTMPMLTLEDLAGEGMPDFVKIDVEGAEVDILGGIRDPRRFQATSFLVECHDRLQALQSILQAHGRHFTIIPHPHGRTTHCWLAVPAVTP